MAFTNQKKEEEVYNSELEKAQKIIICSNGTFDVQIAISSDVLG
jgi:hypothetical protein